MYSVHNVYKDYKASDGSAPWGPGEGVVSKSVGKVGIHYYLGTKGRSHGTDSDLAVVLVSR